MNESKASLAVLLIVCMSCSTIIGRHGEDVRDYYCDGSNPIRNATQNLAVRFPHPPHGMPVENAAMGRQNFEKLIDKYLGSTFVFDMLTDYKNEYHGPHHLDFYYSNANAGGTGWEVFEEIVGGWNWYFNSESLPNDNDLIALYNSYGFPQSIGGDQAWRTIASSVTINKAPQENGDIHYHVELWLGMFCKFAVKREDMYAK